MTDPRVTVAIPVYEGASYIERAIRSVSSQTFGDFEILVIDDGSQDGSAEIVESICDRRIRLLRNGRNEGLALTRNRLVEEARGEFLAWLDQDDICLPHRLEVQVSVLDQNPDTVLSASAARVHHLAGKPYFEIQRSSVSGRALAASQLFWNSLITSTVTMRLQPVRKAGLLFQADLVPAEDYMYWFQVAGLGPIEVDHRVLVERFELCSGASNQQRDRQLSGARLVRDTALSLVYPEATEAQRLTHHYVSEGLPEIWEAQQVAQAVQWLELLANRCPSDGRYTTQEARLVAGGALLRLVRQIAPQDPPLALRYLMGSKLRLAAFTWGLRRIFSQFVLSYGPWSRWTPSATDMRKE